MFKADRKSPDSDYEYGIVCVFRDEAGRKGISLDAWHKGGHVGNGRRVIFGIDLLPVEAMNLARELLDYAAREISSL